LLNHGAEEDSSKEEGWPFFKEAAQRGYLEAIRVLLKHVLMKIIQNYISGDASKEQLKREIWRVF